MLNERDFVMVCNTEPLVVWQKVRSGSMQNAMRFFRELQESLSGYSKHRYMVDVVQKKALALLALLERKIRKDYFAVKRAAIKRNGLILPEAALERKIKEDWGRYYKRIAY